MVLGGHFSEIFILKYITASSSRRSPPSSSANANTLGSSLYGTVYRVRISSTFSVLRPFSYLRPFLYFDRCTSTSLLRPLYFDSCTSHSVVRTLYFDSRTSTYLLRPLYFDSRTSNSEIFNITQITCKIAFRMILDFRKKSTAIPLLVYIVSEL